MQHISSLPIDKLQLTRLQLQREYFNLLKKATSETQSQLRHSITIKPLVIAAIAFAVLSVLGLGVSYYGHYQAKSQAEQELIKQHTHPQLSVMIGPQGPVPFHQVANELIQTLGQVNFLRGLGVGGLMGATTGLMIGLSDPGEERRKRAIRYALLGGGLGSLLGASVSSFPTYETVSAINKSFHDRAQLHDLIKQWLPQYSLPPT